MMGPIIAKMPALGRNIMILRVKLPKGNTCPLLMGFIRTIKVVICYSNPMAHH